MSNLDTTVSFRCLRCGDGYHGQKKPGLYGYYENTSHGLCLTCREFKAGEEAAKNEERLAADQARVAVASREMGAADLGLRASGMTPESSGISEKGPARALISEASKNTGKKPLTNFLIPKFDFEEEEDGEEEPLARGFGSSSSSGSGSGSGFVSRLRRSNTSHIDFTTHFKCLDCGEAYHNEKPSENYGDLGPSIRRKWRGSETKKNVDTTTPQGLGTCERCRALHANPSRRPPPLADTTAPSTSSQGGERLIASQAQAQVFRDARNTNSSRPMEIEILAGRSVTRKPLARSASEALPTNRHWSPEPALRLAANDTELRHPAPTVLLLPKFMKEDDEDEDDCEARGFGPDDDDSDDDADIVAAMTAAEIREIEEEFPIDDEEDAGLAEIDHLDAELAEIDHLEAEIARLESEVPITEDEAQAQAGIHPAENDDGEEDVCADDVWPFLWARLDRQHLLPARPTHPSPEWVAANAASVRQVRRFYAIPDSVPTAQIPSFFRNHPELVASVQSEAFKLKDGGIIARTATKKMRQAVDAMCRLIVWAEEPAAAAATEKDEDDEDWSSDSSFQELDSNMAPGGQHEHEEEEDEDAADDGFVHLSAAAGHTVLVTETQQPRLREEAGGRHEVRIPSPLRRETFAFDRDGRSAV
ncbi:uncharacterized protein L3040_006485 [Drepanopeziza brunnea f. sp. 'multigermtubi']|uniref:Uncharacterized protein n=1 Tax=Marssonina brunnea f. sp. multigermtubi (strain MB_m1) TaxID=1072389 RepID=K1X182_MARBU|nr:uncharacterized protein MBM_02228 [Drepanopeziza brunnea f. sp. 'multigermtubi' MB_m1]EKD18991.1 hypothetical protein MBM_02228 [Drepanopeziza brunnea f. sp. 'multigermtubi' MB_m1]KAJ5038806.1 hypothetical protein L3040_006485 [Drepanopeziza brunnea f. sp. 'multigermtubi']